MGIREKVKKIRTSQRKTQMQLATELGIHGTQISEIESGRASSLPDTKLEFVLDYLGIKWTKKNILELRQGLTVVDEAVEEPKEVNVVAKPLDVTEKGPSETEILLRRELDLYKNIIIRLIEGSEEYRKGFTEAVKFLKEVEL